MFFLICIVYFFFFFFFNDTATTEIYTLSLHDALPICSISFYRLARTRPSRFIERERTRRCGLAAIDIIADPADKGQQARLVLPARRVANIGHHQTSLERADSTKAGGR